ncbi:MAG: hypothetical protein V3V49_11225 [Candidatus Krumholzibacteria bacterium]
MKLRVALVLIVVCLAAVVFSCRRNQPSLVDANRAPETELWYAPPDSTEYEYLVHLYWRGIDVDGIAVRYIWTITDTIVPGQLGWDPSQRIRDFRTGHITSRSDSVFSFTAFRNVGGVGLKKNRQAFHIAAIDDNGVIDPTPARIEFVATVEKLPEMRFATTITNVNNGVKTVNTKPFDPAAIDTVGMFRPFEISYHGFTTNGLIRAYKFFPLTADVVLVGEDVWNEDLTDTLQRFANGDPSQAASYTNSLFVFNPDALPSGRFRFAAQVRDDAGAESRVDAGTFKVGVVQLVVNFEPDTEIFELLNTFTPAGSAVPVNQQVNFTDGQPDTVPQNSWITLFYRGWDRGVDPAGQPGLRTGGLDSSICRYGIVGDPPPLPEDLLNECLAYQVRFVTVAQIDGGFPEGGVEIESNNGWKPGDPEDSNAFGTTDSTSMNMGSMRYRLFARTVDEYGKPDGTPPEISLMGNLKPTLDTYSILNHDGTVVGDGDTLRWNWWRPVNFPDTLDFSEAPKIFIRKEFLFVISATGHDDPREPSGTGVRAWLYDFTRTATGAQEKFLRAGFWSDGLVNDALADTFRVVFRYDFFDDPDGSVSFSNRQDFYDQEYNFTVRGRDGAAVDNFEQFMFLNGEKKTINKISSASISRLTGSGSFRFYFTLERQ